MPPCIYHLIWMHNTFLIYQFMKYYDGWVLNHIQKSYRILIWCLPFPLDVPFPPGDVSFGGVSNGGTCSDGTNTSTLWSNNTWLCPIDSVVVFHRWGIVELGLCQLSEGSDLYDTRQSVNSSNIIKIAMHPDIRKQIFLRDGYHPVVITTSANADEYCSQTEAYQRKISQREVLRQLSTQLRYQH